MLALKYLLLLTCGINGPIHSISDAYLTLYLVETISEQQFRYGFGFPNSEYIPVGECVVKHKEMVQETVYDFQDYGVEDE